MELVRKMLCCASSCLLVSGQVVLYVFGVGGFGGIFVGFGHYGGVLINSYSLDLAFRKGKEEERESL